MTDNIIIEYKYLFDSEQNFIHGVGAYSVCFYGKFYFSAIWVSGQEPVIKLESSKMTEKNVGFLTSEKEILDSYLSATQLLLKLPQKIW